MPAASGRLTLLAPTPALTITVEPGAADDPEIHIHAGGQGFWVARMARLLGAEVTMCAALGGESGDVLRSLIDASGVRLKAVECEAWSGAYVHDRRGGERCTVAETQSPRLTRHEADGLYGLTLAAGLEAEVVLLTGTSGASLEADFFRRLATDLGENGLSVMADLSGDQLQAALAGGLQLVRVSEDQVVEDGYASSTEEAALVAGLGRLCEAGARNAVVSRAGRPALARVDERLLELRPPRLEPVETRGAGDSQSAAIAARLARGATLEDALRFGTAAGALNVTRRGLGSGDRASIEELVQHVEVVEKDDV